MLGFITTSHYEFDLPLINKESEYELVKLIQAGENETVEFKQFIGVNDDGAIIGLENGEFGKKF